MTAPRRLRHRAADSSTLGPLQHLLRTRARVAPALQRRYRTVLAGGLGLALVAGVSGAAVVEEDAPAADTASLAALGLEVDHPASPGITVPEDEEVELGELEVDVELPKPDVTHVRDIQTASRNAERRAIAEREAAAAAQEAAAQTTQPSRTSGDEDDAGEPAEDDAQVTVSAGSGGERRAIGAMVNDYRAQNGLHTLERNGTLDQVAQSWAEWMAANQTLQHNPNYRSQIGSGWSAAGENIIRHTGGASMSSSAVTSWMVDWWKNSSVHRANMLNSKYTHVGVGYSMGPGGPYAVLLLGGR
ncbi:CAP domain-containing protein [uncultured Georgenia sp.]|uniref:CAP domain-containing protein n=1 Tax=uncultured Georgenia sp. TaxID=378209 RepID=UPI00260651BC|nr:CAP domain-containing protein [uncultured Georgenia sp.]